MGRNYLVSHDPVVKIKNAALYNMYICFRGKMSEHLKMYFVKNHSTTRIILIKIPTNFGDFVSACYDNNMLYR